ncbi:hypothetical protein SAMN05421835_11416 [Amycolatopsis sacchari]|uniref:Uncharacterized protein n=1 Tax=Amycolatopsis sacchari TaxID=115433 RepID=A0A1I3WW68_9PSEU|nr:hypothetical protein SAMN05421835_11416 [Amycolatopsis sacchari]
MRAVRFAAFGGREVLRVAVVRVVRFAVLGGREMRLAV